MAEDVEGPWMRINEPPHGRLTQHQEQAIRDYAREVLGMDTLRGFNKKMESWGWDFYDVLQEVSP